MKESGVLLVLVFLVTIFSLLCENFFTLETFGSIFTASAEIGIIALGATLLMIAGEFDLSIGSNFALSGCIFALLTSMYGINSYLSFIIALLFGSIIGLINGLVTIQSKIPSFITTLGTMLIFRGLVLIITDGFPISALESNDIMNILSKDIGFGFKSSLFIWLLLCGLFIYLLNFHPFGNVLMATGGNKEASFAMGIKVNKIKLLCFILMGFLSALAGIMQYAHVMSLSPTAGEQYELRAIAIAVIGGSILTGGVGSILGTTFGTIIMGVLASGLVQAGVSNYWFRAFVGIILVMAVIFNKNLDRLKNKES